MLMEGKGFTDKDGSMGTSEGAVTTSASHQASPISGVDGSSTSLTSLGEDYAAVGIGHTGVGWFRV